MEKEGSKLEIKESLDAKIWYLAEDCLHELSSRSLRHLVESLFSLSHAANLANLEKRSK